MRRMVGCYEGIRSGEHPGLDSTPGEICCQEQLVWRMELSHSRQMVLYQCDSLAILLGPQLGYTSKIFILLLNEVGLCSQISSVHLTVHSAVVDSQVNG